MEDAIEDLLQVAYLKLHRGCIIDCNRPPLRMIIAWLNTSDEILEILNQLFMCSNLQNTEEMLFIQDGWSDKIIMRARRINAQYLMTR